MYQVVVTCEYEALHSWPGVANFPELAEVDYLQFPHRHIFKIKAIKRVSHNDRDVEIIMLKHKIQGYLKTNYGERDIGSTSCEMLARDLSHAFDLDSCEVLEDGENGAIYTQERTS